MEGLVQKERPHYHIWIPGEFSTPKPLNEFKSRLRAYYDTKITGLKWDTDANAYWCLKSHKDREAWISYTSDPEKAKCKKPSILLWNAPDKPEVRSLEELILPAPAGELPKPGTVKAKPPSKLESWCAHVKNQLDANPDLPVDRNTLIRLLINYSKGGMNKYRVAEWVNTALFRYLEDSGEQRKDAFEDFCHDIFLDWKKMF